MRKERRCIHGDAKYVNGKRERLYGIWDGMKARCSNPKRPYFEHYGGKGIRVCDDWLKYEPFKKWALENGYSNTLEIDRIKNEGNYEPLNCRWATRKEQVRGTSRIRKTNTTGFRGVRFHKKNKKFTAQIKVNYKAIYIGSFNTAKEAGLAYDEYVKINNLEHTKNFD